MTYTYSSENRLETPANYQYAAFGGPATLTAYARARRQALATLGVACLDGSDGADLARLVGEIRRLLPAFGEATYRTDVLLDSLCVSKPMQTRGVLDALMGWALAGGPAGAGEVWLGRVIQRFEVGQKLYSGYLPGFRKGQGEFTVVDYYIMLALVLCLRYLQAGNARYLSTLLKVTDLLCSLPTVQLSHGNASALVGLIVNVELAAVRTLAKEKGAGRVT